MGCCQQDQVQVGGTNNRRGSDKLYQLREFAEQCSNDWIDKLVAWRTMCTSATKVLPNDLGVSTALYLYPVDVRWVFARTPRLAELEMWYWLTLSTTQILDDVDPVRISNTFTWKTNRGRTSPSWRTSIPSNSTCKQGISVGTSSLTMLFECGLWSSNSFWPAADYLHQTCWTPQPAFMLLPYMSSDFRQIPGYNNGFWKPISFVSGYMHKN